MLNHRRNPLDNLGVVTPASACKPSTLFLRRRLVGECSEVVGNFSFEGRGLSWPQYRQKFFWLKDGHAQLSGRGEVVDVVGDEASYTGSST